MNFIVMIDDDAKWLPDIFTAEPTRPLDGLSSISGVGLEITLNCDDTVFSDASVAVMEYNPGVDEGTEIEPVKPPVELVVMVAGFVV